MRKFLIFSLLLVLMSAVLVPVLAQDDATAEPTTEVTDEATEAPATADATADATAEATDAVTVVDTVVVRLAHFASDAPALSPFVNGAPSGIQDLAYPSMSGWVEVEAGSTLSLVPFDDPSSGDVAGPFVLGSDSGWATLAVVGSLQAGTLAVYAIQEDIGSVPQDCAVVTVFNAIEGSAGFDITGDDGTIFGTGIGFPGSETVTGGTATDFTSQCAPVDASATDEAMSTAEATEEMRATDEAVTIDDAESVIDTGLDFPAVGSVDCILLPVAIDMSESMATDEAVTSTDEASDDTADTTVTDEASSTEEADSTTDSDTSDTADAPAQPISSGQRVANCAYTFIVPAGVSSLSASATGGESPFGLPASSFAPNTYNFVALIGTQDAPEVFTYTLDADQLSGLNN